MMTKLEVRRILMVVGGDYSYNLNYHWRIFVDTDAGRVNIL